MKNLFLIGARGTGKSTVGRVLAERVGWVIVDADEHLEAAAKVINDGRAGTAALHGEAFAIAADVRKSVRVLPFCCRDDGIADAIVNFQQWLQKSSGIPHAPAPSCLK